ncbi:MAG: cobaltochelatase subunit CobN [Paracoccaceae bacterium]
MAAGQGAGSVRRLLPEAVLGPMPHVYPFIVNDPGEGTQAKRRAQAVIVDHLTPPLTRAESYGAMRDLRGAGRRVLRGRRRRSAPDRSSAVHEILTMSAATGLDADVGMGGADAETDLAKLDAYLCELKEAQIRDGLHVFGVSPEGRLERDLIQALVRVARGAGKGGDASLPRALAADLGLGFDPLDCDLSAPWDGPRPAMLDAPDPGAARATPSNGSKHWPPG